MTSRPQDAYTAITYEQQGRLVVRVEALWSRPLRSQEKCVQGLPGRANAARKTLAFDDPRAGPVETIRPRKGAAVPPRKRQRRCLPGSGSLPVEARNDDSRRSTTWR